MTRFLIGTILFASLVVAGTWAIDGVKGGHRPRYPTSANQYGGNNNNVLCYKTVPYNHALAYNTTSGVPYNTIPLPQDNQDYAHSHGFITILDCCEGYKRNITNGNCDFHCEQGCFGGECTGPNQCTCKSGWFPENGVCMPVCLQPCQKDAYCFSPNVCACKLGYDEVNGECRPICPGGCRNGDCIAPRVCRCKSGYVLNNLQECVPVCEGGCPHGECTAPGICTCYEGYTNPPNERESCIPYCQNSCNGGQCISPGICNCIQGYVRNSNGGCSPDPVSNQCRYGCGDHGICIGYNRCQCEPGFKSEPDTGRCLLDKRSDQPPYGKPDQPLYGQPVGQPTYGQPVNQSPHGRPVGQPTGNQYEPICDLPCLNGECTGFNQCTCRQGYTFEQNDLTRTRCVPICIGGCSNGVCTSPNHCICNPGYRKDLGVKGKQRCIPSYTMNSLFFFLLCIFIIEIEYSVENSGLNNQGYCTKLVSYRKSKSVPYMESYREKKWGIFYTTKYRWNYRTEYYWAWKTEKICCDLYKQQNEKCVPICFHDCGHGDCVRPNICSCHEGYQLINSHNPVCVAVCKHPCVHGHCTAPDVCTCNPGYRMKSDKFTCEPICNPNCDSKTAYCSEPDICTCREGYQNKKNIGYTICVPICSIPCVNGNCTAPDTCTCNQGYSVDLYDKFTCKPVCDNCVDGTCTAPGICTCNQGYSLNEKGYCKPICSKSCHMGICIAPETCMCHEGYGFLNDSMNVCEPICPKACINGFCKHPNVCECHEGFQVTGDETSLHICIPHCNSPCEPNGECTAPNICTCHAGYSLADNTEAIYFDEESICKPICENVCVNGFCTAPNYCSCSLGYEHSDINNICIPVCNPTCSLHSHCKAPNECICNDGYKLTIDNIGNNNLTYTCEPICNEECINGFCNTPDECSCNIGFEKLNSIESNVCKPICEPSCWSHSSCTAPNVCTCDENYVLTTNKKNSSKCEPNCQPACPPNSICEIPGRCLCKEGYHPYYDNNSMNCEPICEFDCKNGICSLPNTCSCELGYINNKNGSCVAYCSVDCGNGTCTEPEVCSCDEGYVLTEESITCEPYCKNNCTNGNCVAPNDCHCYDGFIKNGNDSDSICVNACKNACNKNGICLDEQGNCDCFFGWNGTACEEPTFCIVDILEEYKAYETLSIIKEQNYPKILMSETYPTCQQCLSEINNQTICFEFQYNIFREQNYSAVCLVDAESKCYITHSPIREVIKVSVTVGGVAILIMITSIGIACYKFKKQKNKYSLATRQNCFTIVPSIFFINMRFNIASLYVIVLLMVDLPKISTLFPWKDMNDQSICSEIITLNLISKSNLIDFNDRKMQFHNVPYYETYWHRVLGIYKQERHRINYKIEYYPTYHTQEKCCKGYKEISNKCVPDCFPDCKNGLCEAPNVCECFPGYSISTEQKHICKPICSNGCWNGECVQPEVCVCPPDYFIDSDGYTCRPNCEDKCDPNNSYCSEPNTCACHVGYKKSNESEMCDPICERECINGKCVEPNICSCYDDYELDVNDSFNCIPKCKHNCLFGTCTAPNVCTCNIGYEPINESNCKPICSQSCIMGVCIAPDICSCVVGYKFSNISVHVCEPHCDPECLNGTCIAPNICKCNEGFIFDEDDETKTICKPFCTSPCGFNAECTAPDRCTCHEGYRFVGKNDTTNNINAVSNNKNGTTCVPICEKDCMKSKCALPDVCICEEGYGKIWVQVIPGNIHNYPCTSICKKICDLNGNCNAPDNCICNNTYHNTNIQGKYICQPFCDINCEHGTCETPSVCTYDEGYKKNEEGRCVNAICHSSCINGTCTKPNVCTCYEGFLLRNETICEPLCENSCLNGTCKATNTCRCNKSYFEIKNNNISACALMCSQNCSEHGTCFDGRNSCSCFFGWIGINCDVASLCVYETTLNSTLFSSVTIINETNSTLTKSYDNAPLCYQCSNSLDNATLCFVVHSNESLTIPTVACFLSTELPCYRRPHNNTLKSSFGITELLVAITIAITLVAAISGYVIIRKCRKQPTNLLPNEQTNSLIYDNDTLIIRDEDYLI
ncbi:uncharacterized protein LOC118442172 [Vespa mandarinia]|uniref:uncharacterized protein LOC118442172 n=1 Tax=Vespa mandarinia TaxID=7446 RepID=UPI00161E3F05|nr:uncharacterized protein LOC118442172 [Vespa mandarinia]